MPYPMKKKVEKIIKKRGEKVNVKNEQRKKES